jgi:metallo-beta-lactamase family protein
MKLSFLGAAETVTGSKYLIEESEKKFLVDCGLFQGFKEWRLLNWKPFPVDPKTIHSVVLTHAHLDHTGYLPLLVKQGFNGPIYASHGTKDLCKILLLDAGHLQEEEAKRANKYGYSKHAPALPLYTEEDAEAVLKYIKDVDFDKTYPLNQAITFSLSHSGHILGSSFVTIKSKNTTLVFTGDLGRPNDPMMMPPAQIQFADYLVLESTYGNRLHAKTSALDKLAEVINSTIAKGGSIVIPSFAVGRSQSILYYIYQLKRTKRIPESIPVYLDSPMAQDATDLWCRYDQEHNLSDDVTQGVCSLARYTQSTEDSKKLNGSHFPAIIISASGMAEGGRVLHHIAHYGPKPENTILFAGFQAQGTRGRDLVEGKKEIKIFGQMIPIRARVENLDVLSSHADYEEVLEWLKSFKKPPKRVFITHGETSAAESLKSKIEEAYGWKVTVPRYLESFELN